MLISTLRRLNRYTMKPTLYVLDDDEQYAKLLVEVASTAGWEASHEISPGNFIDKTQDPDGVLVLDLDMPEMDGIEVIRSLAKSKSALRIILISGFDTRVLHSAKQLAEAHNIRVIESLPKPVPISKFIEVLSAANETFHNKKKITKERQPVLKQELETALATHQFVMHYQPQINMKTKKLEGVESLVRWQHPERGLLLPDQFINLAEQQNLIDPLTEEIINLCIKQQQQWQLQGVDIAMSINVSAENITSLSLPEKLKQLTKEHSVHPEMITLELTESAVMNKLTSSLDVLNRLRMKGFALSIDDFGTGYSSLTHLYQAPFTELKIDQKFVMNMATDTEAQVIVKICIMLGKMLGMKLVAEGIETQQVWDMLESLDCDSAQGYFISKPMPADKLIDWINK